ncbi:MAG: hypothetical protein IKI64_01245 [Clostridia bacterium]|nr:hypothetical protein [Clostridia bacterium]
MNSKKSILPTLLSALALVLAAAALAVALLKKAPMAGEASTQYVIYVGTNDMDTYAPKYSQEEARRIVDEICLRHFEGYTLQEAIGSWTDEKQNITHEYTIVCYFDDADRETVYKAADEIIAALNQNTVLIERDDIRMEYYSGK